MIWYLLRRVALVIPTLLGIFAVNFFLIQMAPGGPVEQYLAPLWSAWARRSPMPEQP